MKYALTDGSEVFEVKEFTFSELEEAELVAKEATSGNLAWVPEILIALLKDLSTR